MATAGVPLWSTTAASNGTADPAVNMAEGMAPSAVNDSVRALMASVAKYRDDQYGITTGGTSTAYTVTTGSTFATAAAMSGVVFTIIPNATSGAAPTLAVDGLTARAINARTGVAVGTAALVSGTPYQVKYVHASTEFILLGGSGNISGSTTFSDLALTDSLVAYDISATSNKNILVSDALKITTLLTEDTSPDGAADFLLSYDTSASAAKKVLPANLPVVLPQGYNAGGIGSNGTDTTNDINLTAGSWRDSTNTVNIAVSANTSGKQLDANWAASGTTNSGMRNSAVGIANGTYHIYAARTAASSAATIYAYAGVAGTDPDSAAAITTMLTALQAESGGSSYIYARRLFSILREGGSIVQFTQHGDYFQRNTVINDVSANNPNTAAVTRTLSVPVGINVIADVMFGVVNTASSVNVAQSVLSDLATTDTAPTVGYSQLPQTSTQSGANGANYTELGIRTNTSAQIRSRISNSDANTTLYITTRGWTDQRGKNA